MRQLIFAEIQGATRHPACQSGGRLIAMPIIDPRPYVGSARHIAVQARTPVAYWQSRGLDPEQLAIRIDAGTTFASIGLRQPSSDEAGQELVGADAPEAVAGYLSGCLDYRKHTNMPKVGTDGWVGSEFENLCRLADILSDEGFGGVTVYLNTLAEATLTSWMHGAGTPEADAALSAIASSPRARARGFPPTVDPVRDWAAWWVACRKVINTTAHRMCRDAGFKGRIVLSESCGIDLPARNFDLRPQPACELAPGQVSHANWTAPGPEHTAACIDCLHKHRAAKLPYWAHFSIRETPVVELAWRLRFGAPQEQHGAAVVFGDGQGDLDALGALADLLKAW